MVADLRAERHAALNALCEHNGLSGLLVTSLPNIRYLTGFSGTAGVVLVLREGLSLFTDFRYREQAEAEVGGAARVEIVGPDTWTRVWEALRAAPGLDTVGYESHVVTVQQSSRFAEAALPCRLRPVSDLVERLRVRKHAVEVAAIRRAAQLASEALRVTLESVRVGQTELDVAARLESELRRRGSEWHPFPTIAASGPRSALPHARTSLRPIGPGDLLLLDFGAQLDGYCADLTRTVVVGRRADERQRVLYQLVQDAQRVARSSIRAGMTGRDADALARSLIDARGFGDAFGHSLGHGLGLEVHEAPRVSKANTEPLPAGAVVTVEPGVYLAGWGGVRIEDDVHLSPAGPELLSDGATDLIELAD